jgi:hypothetical protein
MAQGDGREAEMGGIDVGEVAIILLIVFMAGAMGGVVLVVSFASLREDRRYSLTGEAPGPVCAGARRLTGVGVRGDRFVSVGLRGDENGGEDTQGQEPDR